MVAGIVPGFYFGSFGTLILLQKIMGGAVEPTLFVRAAIVMGIGVGIACAATVSIVVIVDPYFRTSARIVDKFKERKNTQGVLETGAAPFRCGLVGYHLNLDPLLS